MKSLAYPLFGLLVLGGYYVTASRGIDPFAVSAERRGPMTAAGPRRTGGSHRPGGVFFYGGFGGGK